MEINPVIPRSLKTRDVVGVELEPVYCNTSGVCAVSTIQDANCWALYLRQHDGSVVWIHDYTTPERDNAISDAGRLAEKYGVMLVNNIFEDTVAPSL